MRDYARYPALTERRNLWSYNLIVRGAPSILLSDGVHRLSAGDAVLFTSHGTYPLGFKGDAGQLCEVLIWTWRTPPSIREVGPALGGYHISRMGREPAQRLTAIHSVCRREVARRDSFTERLLRGLRVEIDTEFGRAILSVKPETDVLARVEEADRWLRAHLDQENPIFDLCDFLQLSHSTVGRMFRSAFGESSRTHFHRLRMEEAQRLLDAGKHSVKQVAYRLGYKHPSDFSRAFRAYQAVKP
jgi:AraC-like DNA-binding protein